MKLNDLPGIKIDREKIRALFRTEYILLFLIVAAGTFLRFKDLTFQSLWLDELISVFSSSPSQSFSDIIRHYQGDPHPPGFFLILHYWLKVFGWNEFSARFLPALIGSLSILSVYFLGKECHNKNTGLIASTIVAFNHFNLYYSQEVRPYILLFLAASLSYTFFIRGLKKQNWKTLILYSLSSALLIYSHYYSLFILLSQVIYFLYHIIFEENIFRPKLLKFFGFSAVIVTLLYAPWLPTLLKMTARKSHWIKKPPKPDFFITLFDDAFGNEPYLVLLFSGLLLVLLFHYVNLKKQRAFDEEQLILNRSLPVLFAWIFFSLFIPYYRSIVNIPMYHVRYALGTLPAFMVLVAVAIESFKNRTFKILLLSTVILVSWLNIFYHKDYYHRVTKAGWKAAVELTLNEKKQKENLFVISNDSPRYNFYFQSRQPAVKVFPAILPSLKNIIAGDAKDAEIRLLDSEQQVKYAPQFTALLNKHFKRIREDNFYLIRSSLWIRKDLDADALFKRYLGQILKTPGQREVMPPAPPVVIGKRGEFKITSPGSGESNVMEIVNTELHKKGKTLIQIGYLSGKKDFPPELLKGKYIHLVLKAKCPGNAPGSGNTLFIKDYVKTAKSKGDWDDKSVEFSFDDWLTYGVSKKIREGASKLTIGFQFSPRNPEDRLLVKDIKLFITDEPLH